MRHRINALGRQVGMMSNNIFAKTIAFSAKNAQANSAIVRFSVKINNN